MATLYFTGSSGEDWNNANNWSSDPDGLILASGIPSSSDSAVILSEREVQSYSGSGTPTVVNLTVEDGSSLLGLSGLTIVVTGIATFEGFSKLSSGAQITGNVVFNGTSQNYYGNINGDATFNDYAQNINGGEDIGPINATFNDYSHNSFGSHVGDATFNDNSYNSGSTDGNATFNDTSFNSGFIGGDATFNNSSYNDSGAAITTNAIFNDLAYNLGTITGNPVFNSGPPGPGGAASYNDGTIIGNPTFNNFTVNGTNGAITGNTTFNNNAVNLGTITGDATFTNTAFTANPQLGSVSGDIIFAPAAVQSSLLLHFDGDDASTTFTDSSVNNLTVTANGDAQISTAQSKFGGASGYFDGSSDYLSVSDTALVFGTGDFTVEAWVFADAASSGYRHIFDTRTSDSTGFSLGFDDQNRVFLYSDNAFRVEAGAATAGEWHHLAVCRSNGTTRVFLDGAQVGTDWANSMDYQEISMLIGTYYANSSLYGWNGYIDDVRVIKTAIYTSNFTLPTAPLSASITQPTTFTITDAAWSVDTTAWQFSEGSPIWTFNGTAYNDTTGSITGSGSFNGTSYNTGTISGNFVFNGTTYNAGTITGNPVFNTDSHNAAYATITGDPVFNDSAYNAANANVTGNPTFNDLSYNGGTVTGNATFTAAAFGGSGNPPLNPVGTVTGTVTFSSLTPVAFTLGGTDPAEFWAADSSSWVFTTSGQNWTFNDSSYNNSVVNGDATFNDTAYNVGTVAGNATFSGGLDVTAAPYNSGTVGGDATFSVFAYNNATVSGNAVFNDYAVNKDGATVTGNATFNDNSYNAFASTPGGPGGSVGGNATLYDGAFNGGTITGNAQFNDNARNFGPATVTGDATFTAASYVGGGDAYPNPQAGTVTGAVIFSPAAPAVSQSSLLLHFDGENTSTTFTDSSQNAAPVTANGSAQISTAISQFGGASGYFDTGSYLSLDTSSDFDLSISDFTIEGWLNATTFGGYFGIAGSRASFAPEGWCLYLGPDNTLYTGSVRGENPYADTQLHPTPIAPNTWTHFALVKTSAGYKLYLNGVGGPLLVDGGFQYLPSAPIAVGALSSAGELPFYGYIDEFRIIKTAIYTTGDFTPPAEPLPAAITFPAPVVTFTLNDATDPTNTSIQSWGADISTWQFPTGTPTFTFNDSTYNQGTLTGANVVFNETSYNTGGANPWDPRGYITGDPVFNDTSSNSGTITGDPVFNDSAYNAIYSAITGDAVFNETSYNEAGGSITGNPVFNDTSYNKGGVTGDAVFNDTAYNHGSYGFNPGDIGTITGNPVFNDSSYNDGAVNGNATFNDTAFNDTDGAITGDATFTSATFTASPQNGGVQGGVIFSPPFPVVQSSLLLHFDGEDGSTTFTDSSINAATVTANGSAQISTAQSQFGGASGYFDGSSYISLDTSSNFDLSTSDFTIEGWLYLTSGGASYGITGSRTPGFAEGWCLYVHPDGTIYTGSVRGEAAYADTQLHPTPITPHEWAHFALVKTAAGYKLYLNGVAGPLLADGGFQYLPSSPVAVGSLASGSEAPFVGHIDEFRIIKTAIYTADFTPPAAPLDASVTLSTLPAVTFTITDEQWTTDTVPWQFPTGTPTWIFNGTASNVNTLVGNAIFNDSSENTTGTISVPYPPYSQPITGIVGSLVPLPGGSFPPQYQFENDLPVIRGGLATFNDSSLNLGYVANAVFNDTSSNSYTTTPIPYPPYSQVNPAYVGLDTYGMPQVVYSNMGNAVFNDDSVNNGSVRNTATFNDNSYNAAIAWGVGGQVNIGDPWNPVFQVYGEATFNDNSYNDSFPGAAVTFNDNSYNTAQYSIYDATFNGDSYNEGTVQETAFFNDNAYNAGYVIGDATFSGSAYNADYNDAYGGGGAPPPAVVDYLASGSYGSYTYSGGVATFNNTSHNAGQVANAIFNHNSYNDSTGTIATTVAPPPEGAGSAIFRGNSYNKVGVSGTTIAQHGGGINGSSILGVL